jgi:TPR repeat protein
LQDAKPPAEQGIPAAQILLGNMYERGRGVAKDYGIAIEWYMKAYRQGDVSAEYWLNLLHKKGTPLSCNSKLVDKILVPLAIEGYPPAMNSLCVNYTMGLCLLPQDFQLAREWCEKAEQHGLPGAKDMLDKTIPKMEKLVVQRQNEIKQHEREASLGDFNAHVKLGMLYFYGDTLQGISKDYTRAAQWFRKSAENGNTEAQIYLGMIYQEQDNPEEAEKWYRIPAESGDARAQLNLAMLYIDQGKTYEALELIKSSAQKNYPMAKYLLGSIYEEGPDDIPQDYVQAYMWYWLACTDTDLECDTIPLFSGPESLGKKMTESEISRAKNLANKWLR